MPEPNPIYFKDLIDPRRSVSLFYFSPLMLFFGVSVLLIYIGLPALFIAGAGDDDGNPVPADATVAFARIGYLICGVLWSYFFLVVCINRLRAAGLSLWLLLVPGYNLYLLFTAPDIP
ncbi:hypothetical protein [Neolewinella persica]|uniref:hypothetical protein n=1 Tax=Neolewinella persica TaxID=70998 RepID=UPI00037CC0C3|nr:hypothetical protein [Neolewinella persica]